jgi:hypothetical protein
LGDKGRVSAIIMNIPYNWTKTDIENNKDDLITHGK